MNPDNEISILFILYGNVADKFSGAVDLVGIQALADNLPFTKDQPTCTLLKSKPVKWLQA